MPEIIEVKLSPATLFLIEQIEKQLSRITKATEMAVQAMGIYADSEFKDLPDDMLVFRNIIDVLQEKGE